MGLRRISGSRLAVHRNYSTAAASGLLPVKIKQAGTGLL